MSRQIVVLSNDISDFRDSASSFKEDKDFLGDKPQGQQQRGSKKVDNDKDVRVPAVRDSKIITFMVNAKLAVKNLLTVSTKVALVENGQNVSIKKI